MNIIGSRKFHDSVRRTGPSVAVVAGIVWALCLPYEAGAQGGFNGPGRYEITNWKSGKVLDLDRNDQTSVIQFSSRGAGNQVSEIRPAGSSFYYLQNTRNGNEIEAVGTRNSMPVRARRFSGGSSQQWRFETAKVVRRRDRGKERGAQQESAENEKTLHSVKPRLSVRRLLDVRWRWIAEDNASRLHSFGSSIATQQPWQTDPRLEKRRLIH